jgi:sugar lactone lactonase YvrE
MRYIGTAVLLCLAIVSCSSDDSSPPAGNAGSGGSNGGSGGAVGSGGSSTGGSNGTGGDATGGSVGTGGSGTGGDLGAGGSDMTDGGAGGSLPAEGGAGGSTGTVQCGSTNANLAGFTAQESIVVGPDGTIYSCSRSAILGRFAPPYTTKQNTWLNIVGAQVFGIALDPKKKVLYAGARAANKVYRIALDAPTPTAEILTDTSGSKNGINGVTLGEDGAVYYSDQAGGNIYRLDPDTKMTTQVTKTTIGNANGIAFAPPPDGRLWVVTYTTPGAVTRFKVDANHTEVDGSRDSFDIAGSNRADGIAFDKMGDAYVTAGALYKITALDKKATHLADPGGANVEFGAGALSCNLILWANGGGVQSKVNDVAGADVPWHRP